MARGTLQNLKTLLYDTILYLYEKNHLPVCCKK